MSEISLRINKVILHILDKDAQMPILSEKEHPLDKSEIIEFLQKHISKALEDSSLKKACFNEEGSVLKQLCEKINATDTEFVNVSNEVANRLYDIVLSNPEVSSADLICVLFELNEAPYLGILKFNYRTSFIHYVEYDDSTRVNTILKQRTALPNDSSRLDECAFINLDDFSMIVVEKKVEINGEKQYYFSNMFLECRCKISDKEKVRAFNKANQKFNKEYFDSDVAKLGDIKKAVKDSIEESGVIDVEQVAQDVFKGNPEMKNTYVQHIQKAGFDDKKIELKKELGEKAFTKQRIKTDTGIEIKLPIDYCNNKDVLEFINNSDGTISILIKNINKIVDR